MLYIDFITVLPCDIAHYKPYTLIYMIFLIYTRYRFLEIRRSFWSIRGYWVSIQAVVKLILEKYVHTTDFDIRSWWRYETYKSNDDFDRRVGPVDTRVGHRYSLMRLSPYIADSPRLPF